MKRHYYFTETSLPGGRRLINQTRKFLSLFAIFLVLTGIEANAQFLTAASYPFTAAAKPFTYLSGGTNVSLQADDITVTGIPLGFTFNYCGNNYTTVSACSNGFMALGNKTSAQWTNSQSNASSITPMLMPLWDDLQGSGSTTSYKTTGSAGSRVFTFEWRNTRPLSSSNAEITIQAILYEGANAIEFMYKQEAGTATFSSASIGIVGNTNNDYQTLNNSSSSPVPSTSTFNTGITAKPATGQSYLWGYLKKGYNNAAVSSIASPTTSFCSGVTLPVSVVVKNTGYNRINNVEVHWKVDNINQPTINWNTLIDTLGSVAGNSATVNLGNVFFGATAHTIVIYTSLPNGVADTVNGDDTLTVTLGAALSGIYTIGGVTPDFPDVVSAASALNAYGVCGPVTFNIRPGAYNQGPVSLKSIAGSSTTNTITFQSENGVASSTIISSAAATFEMKGTSNIRVKNLTITSTGLAYVMSMTGSVSNDSITGCNLAAPVTSSSSSAAFYGTDFTGTNSNIVFANNTLTGGYYSFYWYGNSGSYTPSMVVDNNSFSQYDYYGAYFYYTNGLKFRGNEVIGSTYSYYNVYMRYTYASPVITGNHIDNNYGYSMYVYYMSGSSSSDKGIVANNVVTMIGGTSNYGGIYINYPTNMKLYNNTAYATGTYSTCNTFMAYMSSGYNNNEIYNNASINTGGGYGVYIYNAGTNNVMDYNNWYTTATSGGYYYNAPQNDLAAFRTTSLQDKNSISYDPQLNIDGTPNPNAPGCWALNGRGVHMTGNDKDYNGKARVTVRADGVPDIGAFEFVPESVPPAAIATPSTADPGDVQVFTFGGNQVAKIAWGPNNPTANVQVRQYSGEKGVGVATAASPFGSMYFHTDITAAGTAFEYDLDINYMDIWLGDIANEPALRMAQKIPNYQWMVYSDLLSSANTGTNVISAPHLNRYGSYTGLENGSIPSAFVKPQGKTIICIGNTVQLNAEPQNGDFYKWYKNGVEIIGASGPNYKTYTTSLPGDYSVAITYSGKVVESAPVSISTISIPNAIIQANGPLTYCIGNGLTLNAGSGTGLKYQWQLNGADIPGANNNTYQVNQTGNYTVVVENIACASVSTIIPIKAGPLNVYLGKDTSYCEIKNVFAKLDAGYPGAQYTWNTGEKTQTIEVKQGGTYWVRVDAGPNCIANDTIAVTIDPLPKANGISFVKQNTNTYQFFPSGPVGAIGFLWLFSDGTTSNINNPVKTITGDLYVRLVMFNTCGSDTVQLGWPLTVENISDAEGLTVYPNPAHNKVTVSLKGTQLQSVEVLNSVGAVVYRAVVTGTDHSIDVSGMASGHYILHAITASGIVNKQFDIIQ